MNGKETEEFISIKTAVEYKNWDSYGEFLSRYFNLMKEKEEIWANRCNKCGRIAFPPIIVCGYCKIRIEDKEKNWVKLGNKGTVLSYFVTSEKGRDRSTGALLGASRPVAYVRPDGGDEYTLLPHYLEETDLSKVHVGMKVEAVWKPREERRGRMSDILYLRTIEG